MDEEKKKPTFEVFTPDSPNLPKALMKIVGKGIPSILKRKPVEAKKIPITFQRMNLWKAAQILEKWDCDCEVKRGFVKTCGCVKLAARSMSMGCCILVDKHKEAQAEITKLKADNASRATAQLKAEKRAAALQSWSTAGDLLRDCSGAILNDIQSDEGLDREKGADLVQRIESLLEGTE